MTLSMIESHTIEVMILTARYLNSVSRDIGSAPVTVGGAVEELAPSGFAIGVAAAAGAASAEVAVLVPVAVLLVPEL